MKKLDKHVQALLSLVLILGLAAVLAVCAASGGDIASNFIAVETFHSAVHVLQAIAIALAAVAGAWSMVKIGENKQLENISLAIQHVVQAAQMTVGELQQTSVAEMKAASVTGRLTQPQITALQQQVQEKTVKKLTIPILQLLEDAGLDINALICGIVENLIHQMH